MDRDRLGGMSEETLARRRSEWHCPHCDRPVKWAPSDQGWLAVCDTHGVITVEDAHHQVLDRQYGLD
jgi:hypothetical protein